MEKKNEKGFNLFIRVSIDVDNVIEANEKSIEIMKRISDLSYNEIDYQVLPKKSCEVKK